MDFSGIYQDENEIIRKEYEKPRTKRMKVKENR